MVLIRFRCVAPRVIMDLWVNDLRPIGSLLQVAGELLARKVASNHLSKRIQIAYCASKNQSVDVYVPGDAPPLASFHEFSHTALPRKEIKCRKVSRQGQTTTMASCTEGRLRFRLCRIPGYCRCWGRKVSNRLARERTWRG